MCKGGVRNKLVWGVLSSRMDPATKADWMSVERYCKEIWLGEEEVEQGTKAEPSSGNFSLAKLLEEAYLVAKEKHVGPV